MKRRQIVSSVFLGIYKPTDSQQNCDTLLKKNECSEFLIKIANSLEEREAVFRLGYKLYLERGYIKENANEWLVQNYDLNSETIILIVKDKEKEVVGSATLIFDGAFQLPAEIIYGEELNTLRKSNNKIAELSRLVVSKEYRNSKEVLVLLFNYAAIYIRQVKKFNSLIVQVNPRHRNYYKTLLSFDEIGSERPYPLLQNAPAILLYLSTNKYQTRLNHFSEVRNEDNKDHSLYQYFLKMEQEGLAAYYLAKQIKPMTVEEKIYFDFSTSGTRHLVCL